jgi:hypothetical protein
MLLTQNIKKLCGTENLELCAENFIESSLYLTKASKNALFAVAEFQSYYFFILFGSKIKKINFSGFFFFKIN